MTQKNIIIGVIVAIVLIGGAWFLMTPKQNEVAITPDTEEQTETVSNTPTQSVKATGTLKSTFTQGGNYTCTLTTIDGSSGKTTGTVYASGGKTRSDFKIQSATGAITELHIIRDGVTAYTWVAGQSSGTKTAITASSSVVPRQPSGAVISVTDDSSVSTDCHPWLPDISQFVPPTSITFVKS